MRLRERIQQKIDAYLLRKAKEEAKGKITNFLKPPEVKMKDEVMVGQPVTKKTRIDYPLIELAEHFSLNYIYVFIQLLNNLLQEETEINQKKNKE